ncbi:putative sulfate transporter [Streptomyces cyanogenus]|uniref:Sulfate transporter n=1 Tax=Streptomyces cyanogenus TaxID=80860 RepID=A0ABX7TYV7_STRCY|nr:putative sulfate transporter [Streptomyces cyanogenus]
MPGLGALTGYRRSWLRGDLLAGVTVAAYLVPQLMAYAGAAGLPPVAGLWAILPALALYAMFGSSRLLSVGPESTTALMTATVVGPLADGDAGRYASLAAALAVTVGLLRPGGLRGHGAHLPHAAHRGRRLSRVEWPAIKTGGCAAWSGTGHSLCHPTVRSGRISVPDLPWTIS